ncbi:MAG TPA: 1-(5-phosphoribosyl)-5-[(5-phosphoribosylamino)methylideneamino] imidazole-4-carboxamide isomerase [Acidimicrobiia bacterium]|nr:1-(5-phosphoribosyl)-5-[(5-phosphoribosylamino)methylideneamino] imidazole-4-carboxamide isomerase [Acidimicrobiia bacterium]
MLDIIPAVDVLDGSVVRLTHGDFDRVTVYDPDPVARARTWIDEGAALVHVVDLEGARSGQPSPDLWRRLSSAGVRFQVGGGIRTARWAEAALDAGAERVVLGTAAVWDPDVLAAIGEIGRVVAAVDVRDGRATGGGWLDEGRALGDVLDDLADRGVPRLLVTGIARDGTMQGPETELLDLVLTDRRFRIIASGGVGSIEDLRGLADTGCEGVIVGRALYERRFTLSEALAAL